jgi:hypothetical protein
LEALFLLHGSAIPPTLLREYGVAANREKRRESIARVVDCARPPGFEPPAAHGARHGIVAMNGAVDRHDSEPSRRSEVRLTPSRRGRGFASVIPAYTP